MISLNQSVEISTTDEEKLKGPRLHVLLKADKRNEGV